MALQKLKLRKKTIRNLDVRSGVRTGNVIAPTITCDESKGSGLLNPGDVPHSEQPTCFGCHVRFLTGNCNLSANFGGA